MGRLKKLAINPNEQASQTYKKYNSEWIAIAQEADIPLYERQPTESDREWFIWLKYRDMYPSQKPSYRIVAKLMTTEYMPVKAEAIRAVGVKWDFPVRMQAWVRYCDALTSKQRKEEIVDMNQRHIDMARLLNEKLYEKIQNLDVAHIDIKDLKNLMYIATELERKARVDIALVEEALNEEKAGAVDIKNKAKENTDMTKKEDLKEIINILSNAGVLGNKIGIKQTTEVIAIDDRR